MATAEEQAQIDNPLNIRRMGGEGGLQGMVGDAAKVALSSSTVAQAEQLNYQDTFSGTVTALGTTSTGACNALGLPFDTLTFTASGAVNQVDVHVHFTVNGGVIIIENLNGDTIDISADSNGNSFVPLLRNSAGTIIAATDANLTATGVYYLYLGD